MKHSFSCFMVAAMISWITQVLAGAVLFSLTDSALANAPEKAAFLGLTPEGWTALGTMILAVVTAFLVAIGTYQISAIKSEQLKSRTLIEASKYDTDPVLNECIGHLHRAKLDGLLLKDPMNYRPQIIAILNYLDGVAIGIEQGLYIESLAKDHLKEIVEKHVSEYLENQTLLKQIGTNPANFHRLIGMSKRWSTNGTAFRDSRFWSRTP
ncbi:MAG: DUF4760 domain-containing protein [Beijerinckiaceae bacterium]|nr:DUF4760 domain-containing protein [Beijerinckiaceae bacterium]